MRTSLFVFSALLYVLQPSFRLAAEEPFAGKQSDWNGYVRYCRVSCVGRLRGGRRGSGWNWRTVILLI